MARLLPPLLLLLLQTLPRTHGQGGGLLEQLARQFGANGGQQAPGGGQQRLGHNVEQFLDSLGVDRRLSHSVGRTVDSVAASYFAPSPDSPIPPHVQRRIMRFCTRHPDHPKCEGHPEWNLQGAGPLPPPPHGGGSGDGSIDLNEIFPDFIPFRLPPIPRGGSLNDMLAGVPGFLRQVVPAPVLGQISEIGKQAIQSTCVSMGQCKQQRPESLNQRATIAEQEASIHRQLSPQRPSEQVDNDVELRLARTQQVKQALLKRAGLDQHVEPANNGVFQKDILLTEQQSNALLNDINAASGSGRRKRGALFIENAPNQRWPANEPIAYFFHESLAPEEQSAVEAAIQEIAAKTCLTFTRATVRPTGPHIIYVKIDSPTFCGLSYIGRIEPANPVYLSFQCGNPFGVAIHETLHALGLNHEQLRSDRDKYVTINWANVNPQNYDFFAVADAKQFTSYGIKYDYLSIMHYQSTVASQSAGANTMVAKVPDVAQNTRAMGQRQGMADSDVQLVRRMYCESGCTDANVYCGAWANMDMCTGPKNVWVQQNCKRSCGQCSNAG